MGTEEQKQQYIDDMVAKRGYVLDYHKVLTNQDFDFMKAANDLIEAAYLRERVLDRKTKELIFVATLTAMRASKNHIESHVRVALKTGATPEEILQAIEIVMPEAGVVAFQAGVEAWQAVVAAEGIEPTSQA
ncbi:MAG: carboxymuconolactone decarboxylase family protein [Actinomycetota bacterium]